MVFELGEERYRYEEVRWTSELMILLLVFVKKAPKKARVRYRIVVYRKDGTIT